MRDYKNKVYMKLLLALIFCFSLFIPQLFADNNEAEPEVVLKFTQAGTFSVEGQIEQEEWTQIRNSSYSGKLFKLTINPTWSHGEGNPFTCKGFSYKKDENSFVSGIESPSKKNPKSGGENIRIEVSGFAGGPPKDLKLLIQNFQVPSGKSQSLSLNKDHFSIDNNNPKSMKVEVLGGDYAKKAKIILDFSNEGNSKNNIEPVADLKVTKSNSRIIPVPTQQKEPFLPGDYHKLSLFDNDGNVIYFHPWQIKIENPFNIPDHLKAEKAVLETSYGDFELKIKETMFDYWDSFEKISVKTGAEGDQVILSYKSNPTDITDNVFSAASTDTKGEALLICPKKLSEGDWTISVRRKGYLTKTKRVNENSNRTSIDLTTLFNRKKYEIKATPSPAIVSVIYEDYIIESGKTDKNGRWAFHLDEDFSSKPVKIVIEHSGFVKKTIFLQDLINNGKTITLSKKKGPEIFPVNLVGMNVLKDKIKADPKDIFVILAKKQAKYTTDYAKIRLDDFSWLSEEYERLRLEDQKKRLYFQIHEIAKSTGNTNKSIDVRPLGKFIDLQLNLKDNNGSIIDKEEINCYYDSKWNTFSLNSTKKNYFIPQVKVPYDNGFTSMGKSEALTICLEGYDDFQFTVTDNETSIGNERDTIPISAEISKMPPDVVVVLSGNYEATGDYFYEGKEALLRLWDSFQAESRIVFGIGTLGKFEKITGKTSLEKREARRQAHNDDVESELSLAKIFFTDRKNSCGFPSPKKIVYIGNHPYTELKKNSENYSRIFVTPLGISPLHENDSVYTAEKSDNIIESLKRIFE